MTSELPFCERVTGVIHAQAAHVAVKATNTASMPKTDFVISIR
jgi:hypothetical protein